MATYYVTTTGAGGHTGADEANAFTMEEACDNAAAGDLFYVKANADYTTEYVTGGAKSSIMYLTTDGTAAAPIHWVGYHTVIGDGGVVTIDALVNALQDCLEGTAWDYHIFENFVFSGASTSCVDAATGKYCIFKRCSFEGAGDNGIFRCSHSTFIACIIRDNTNEGIDTNQANNVFSACIFEGNGKEGIFTTPPTVFHDCVFYNNGLTSDFKHIDSAFAFGIVCIDCTFDGENAGDAFYTANGTGVPTFINCIFHDHASAIHINIAGIAAIFACLFNSNVADTTNVSNPFSNGDGIGDDMCVAAVPGFTNEAARDYTLAVGSAALDVGLDADFTTKFWASFDGATNPPVV